MPAEIDTMMFVRETPWHKQGTKLDNAATAAEAMAAAGLDWEVQLQPLFTGPEKTVLVKGRFAACRMDRLGQPDGGQLGVVGRAFTPLQNREAFTFLDPVVGEKAAIYDTAGSLRGGRQVWLLAKLPGGEIRVVGDDVTEKYILLSNGHDGTNAVRIGLTPVRVVCQNTLTLALKGMQGLAIRHHSDVAVRVREAHRLLGIVNTAMDEAGAIMQRMARVSLGADRLGEYFNQVMPVPIDDEAAWKQTTERHHRLRELFEVGDGNTMPGVRGSLWAAYNAVTQWVDRESYTPRLREPLRSIWFGSGAALKKRAFNVAAQLVGASMN
jgi:phage/plasmid-like protein (TIGR03299 family)